MNDVVINKIQSIQRCVARAREEYASDPDGFDENFTVQDAAILNVLRAREQAIDLANHVIRTRQLGIPNSSAETFETLHQNGAIDEDLAGRLKRMIGFRNRVIHQYQRMDINILRAVITSGLEDLVDFADRIRAFPRQTPEA